MLKLGRQLQSDSRSAVMSCVQYALFQDLITVDSFGNVVPFGLTLDTVPWK